MKIVVLEKKFDITPTIKREINKIFKTSNTMYHKLIDISKEENLRVTNYMKAWEKIYKESIKSIYDDFDIKIKQHKYIKDFYTLNNRFDEEVSNIIEIFNNPEYSDFIQNKVFDFINLIKNMMKVMKSKKHNVFFGK